MPPPAALCHRRYIRPDEHEMYEHVTDTGENMSRSLDDVPERARQPCSRTRLKTNSQSALRPESRAPLPMALS